MKVVLCSLLLDSNINRNVFLCLWAKCGKVPDTMWQNSKNLWLIRPRVLLFFRAWSFGRNTSGCHVHDGNRQGGHVDVVKTGLDVSLVSKIEPMQAIKKHLQQPVQFCRETEDRWSQDEGNDETGREVWRRKWAHDLKGSTLLLVFLLVISKQK